MKRSEINRALKEMEAMVKEYRFAVPPFCDFTPEEWQEKGHEYDEIRENMLGWDITDYGLGRFDQVGFSLITIRNGNLQKKDKYPKHGVVHKIGRRISNADYRLMFSLD